MWKKWMGRILSAGLLTAAIAGGAAPAEAAAKNIRVALFIDIGKGYRGVVPTVTLTSEKGMEITAGGKDGNVRLPSLGGDSTRFRVDEYHLLVMETGDLIRAQQVAQQLSQRKLDAAIQVEMRGATPVYQVVSGTFDSYQAAAAQARTVAQSGGLQPVVKGTFRLEAGKFGSLKEAQDWENAFEVSGISAHTVLLADSGKVAYAVWIGDEASKDGANRLAQAAEAAFPAFSYREPSSRSYVVLKKDVVAVGGETETVWKYAFSPQIKLTVEPKKGGFVPLIGVEERERRKYRGTIELSEYKGHLTVVNELPMEQYLYGVVGSEMVTGWPMEALKTQAVLARTRAVSQGNKYGIANLSDTVFEQAYYGYAREAADIRKAVDQTAGEVIKYRGKVAESFFYSNAGGMTSDGTEVWGNPVPYLRPVMSDDSYPLEKAPIWYLVSLQDGSIGYLRSDLVTVSGSLNPMGLQMGMVNTDNTNFRSGPSTAYHRVLGTLSAGTEVTIIQQEAEENAYAWTRGPYTSDEVTAMINASQDRNKAPRLAGPVEWLRVTQRGPSGRVLQMEANGMVLAASSPDAHRSIFSQGGSSLRSTKFEVEETGTFTVLGANGQQRSFPQAGHDLQAIGADGLSLSANGYNHQFVLYNANGDWRVATKQQSFVFRGTGFGHGLGVSQFGAKAMAENGYDYKEILQHYYQDVTIED
ncbi:SpoIID/LytB domain-containing protein [Brevibacillus sp. H7]|uniref:SpoIID/LytB domain-containing protein n=1 Tax=Brevibacillus sp. H7 TaxID=3349138 RepID=UPI0037FE7BEA